MSLILSIVGASVVFLGVLALLRPRRVRDLLTAGESRARFRSAVMTRILLGCALLLTAPSSRFPDVLEVLGLTALLLAIALYRLGLRRFEMVSYWWANRPPMTVRAAAMLAVDFGLILFYAPA